MTRTSGNVRPAVVRPALVGMATALFLVSSAIVAACGYRVTAPDFPVLKLTPVEPATATAAAEAK
jgi:hypothetical protein